MFIKYLVAVKNSKNGIMHNSFLFIFYPILLLRISCTVERKRRSSKIEFKERATIFKYKTLIGGHKISAKAFPDR